jgi:hypothetical protein
MNETTAGLLASSHKELVKAHNRLRRFVESQPSSLEEATTAEELLLHLESRLRLLDFQVATLNELVGATLMLLILKHKELTGEKPPGTFLTVEDGDGS